MHDTHDTCDTPCRPHCVAGDTGDTDDKGDTGDTHPDTAIKNETCGDRSNEHTVEQKVYRAQARALNIARNAIAILKKPTLRHTLLTTNLCP